MFSIIIKVMKKLFVHVRTSIKFVSLVTIGAILIIGTVAFIYQPIYSVSLNGEFVGYSQNKSKLQKKINSYIETGENGNVAFVDVEILPEYELCLLKKDIVTNDEEIYEKVKATGVPYYKYYSVTDDGEEKAYVSSREDAEKIIEDLKSKNSKNKSDLAIAEKYETELKEFTTVEDAVASLYEKPPVIRVANSSSSRSISNQRVPLGINLIQPLSGSITSRFGVRSRDTHTGIDIAAPRGTGIKAAASGTVTFSGGNPNVSYGYYAIVTHSNGVQTYYAHCSQLLVSVGQEVSQGEIIARVGSTGNSTGNHLHLEIRINGVAYNPQLYLY